MSQERLAEEIGVAFSTVNRWEQGYHEPSFLTRKRFEDFCNQKGIKFDHEQSAQYNKRGENMKTQDKGCFQKEIPATSIDRYISGKYALNLPSEMSGDWHFTSVWYSDKPETAPIWGKDIGFDTNPIWGNFGVADRIEAYREAHLDTRGQNCVYTADNYRAILDLMVVGAIKNYMGIVVGATMDYLDTEEQKSFVLNKAKNAVQSDMLSEEQKARIQNWIAGESKNVYRGVAYER
ncbi:MAG: helix-turn-helix transcriptional regulator [Bacteroidales bacterium]|jgi:transcriptional regulator with XRE-family HTH domain|nr:helix-turn-helix transcriptional regulator [Bacteroidales bacterium]